MSALAVLLLLLAPLASAPPSPADALAPPYQLPDTEVRTLVATGSGVEHVLYVSLPREYEQHPERRYPLVLLLDPDYSFAIAHNVIEHFADRGNLPPTVVVGVGYPGHSQDMTTYRRHRTRDYTPTFVAAGGYGPEIQKLSGGGPAFRDFLAAELLPFLERTYRLAPDDRTLVGHSFGGLFVTFVLVTRPELFRRYLVVSPSYWYDDGVIFRLEEAAAAKREDLPARVALLVGERENQPATLYAMVDDLRRFAERLRSRGYRSLEVETWVFDDETHNSVFPAAFTRGIRWLFR